MIEINEKNHISVLIASLDKIYNQARLTGKLNAINLYILNIVYNLLDGCCLELSNTERKQLMDIYRKIYFNSKNICPASVIQKYEITPKITFTQADAEDCNDFEAYPKIYYWQYDSLTRTFNSIKNDVLADGYFDNKPYDTYEVFDAGKLINYSYIGKICFAMFGTTSTNFQVKDVLDNDITDSFNQIYLPALHCTLFVSINNYSHGNVKFKIKKL